MAALSFNGTLANFTRASPTHFQKKYQVTPKKAIVYPSG